MLSRGLSRRVPFAARTSAPRHQRLFTFLERRLHRERRFKQAIALTTCLVIALILGLVPWGRYLYESLMASVRQAGRQAVGLSKSREEIDESWRRFRLMQIEGTRPRVERYFAEADPAFQRLLLYAGMDPEHALCAGPITTGRSSSRRRSSRPTTRAARSASGPGCARSGCRTWTWRGGRRAPTVLPRTRRARTGRGDPGDAGDRPGDVAADDQLLGRARARAGPRRAAARDRPGRLLHAGDVHRRR